MTAAPEPGSRASSDPARMYVTIHPDRDAALVRRGDIDPPNAGGRDSPVAALRAAPSDSSPGLGMEVTAIVDPFCRTTSDPSQPDLLGLHLHHPDLGWLSFALTKTAARTLGDSLVAHGLAETA